MLAIERNTRKKKNKTAELLQSFPGKDEGSHSRNRQNQSPERASLQ